MSEFKVEETVAISDVKSLIDYHLDNEISEGQVKSDYAAVVKSVMLGNLDISNPDKPKLALRFPIKDDKGVPVISEIEFVTRIPPTVLASLSRGIDIQKDSLGLANKMTVYYTQIGSVALLDRFDKRDYAVIQQIIGLF